MKVPTFHLDRVNVQVGDIDIARAQALGHLRERGREEVRSREAPEYLAAPAGGDPGGEERGRS
jgi:hypothetical protein